MATETKQRNSPLGRCPFTEKPVLCGATSCAHCQIKIEAQVGTNDEVAAYLKESLQRKVENDRN